MKGYLIGIIFIICACGGPSKEHERTGLTREQAEELMQTLFLNTSHDTAHIESVGVLGTIKPREGGLFSYGVCTTFRVGERLMMTNSHCIAANTKAPDVDCSANIRVAFGNGNLHVCDKIMFASFVPPSDTYYDLYADIALFTLKTTPDGDILEADPNGVRDGEVLNLIASDPMQLPDAMGGVLRKKPCKMIYANSILQMFGDQRYAFPVFSECAVVQGNSGSPVLNEAGEVTAIVYGNSKSKADRGFAVNMSCVDVDDPRNPWKFSPHCPLSVTAQ